MSMFDGLEGVGRKQVPKERTAAYGACPRCSAEKVGLVRTSDGSHLVWKVHYLTTHGGTSMPCQAGGQYLCDLPARHVVGYDTPHCSHERN